MGPLPPPRPRPPPPPPSSPPGVPPLPPSSPPSDILSKNDGSCSLKDLLDGNNLILERPHPVKPVEDRSVHQIEVPCQHTENNGLEMESADAVVAHSPADSDMDMEDDITHPDEEKKNCLLNNSNDECISISQEDYVKEQLQALHHAGGHRLPKVDLHGNLLFAEASVTKDQRGAGSEVSDCDFPVTTKVSSEADDSGMTENGQTEQPLDVSVKERSSQHKNSSQPSVPVVYAETGYGKLSGQLMEGANPFKLLEGYASDNTSENEGENLLGDVSPPSLNDGSTNFDAQKGCNFGSKLRLESLSESNKHMLSKSMIESPRNVMEADKSSFATGIVGEVSDKSHRGQESVSIGNSVTLQPKDPSGNYDANIGLEGANIHKPDIKSNSTKLNVDEFGRLVREGVSDSDTSDSSHYTRRHARRARKRSSSQSRSRSPHDRRRRRSPWRRKERRGRSRSSSPKRRRSRSRSPVLRRDSEFSGDKWRREKGQLPECFDFLRGKCYRGATCRYSHHETGKSERLRYNRGKQQYGDTPPTLRSPDFHEESNVLLGKEVKDKRLRLPQDMPGLREIKDAKELPVDSTTPSLDNLNSLESGSLLVADVVASNLSGYSVDDMPSGKENSLISESAAQYSDNTPQIVDQQGPTSQLPSVGSPITKPYSTEEVPSHSLKEFPPSTANHPSQLTLPLPSVSQVMSAPFAQPITQDYNLMPPIARFHSTPENYSPYQAPVAHQHSHFPGPSNSLSSSFLPPPPPPPPHSHLSVNVTTGERSIPSQHMQQSLLPARDGISFGSEPDQMLHMTDNFGSSNLTSRQGGPHILGEDRLTGHPVQGMNHLQSFPRAQPYSLPMQSPSKGTHSSLGGGIPSDGNSSHARPYIQQASYGLQYSAASGAPAQLAQTGNVSSSMSRITSDFLGRNHPSYGRDFVGSRISNHFNPYASTFDQTLSSKFSSNALMQENDTTIDTKYGAPVGMGAVPVNAHKIGSVGSKDMISLSSSGLPAESVLPRPGGDQYDPLFDSIEPASNSFGRADHIKHDTTGDSDNMPRFSGSGRVLDMEDIKQDGGIAVSANDSLENEEYGETADAEVGAVLNGSPSNPNDATDMNAGEIEIDQVKASGKKKKGKDSRSMKLFKISIATFVKEVLKPSWRQGNMSKEAFKTIVKKTVDKVSGAMKSHQIPKSQAKINHYIDSSRGKLTKLVMGYVDKYVKQKLRELQNLKNLPPWFEDSLLQLMEDCGLCLIRYFFLFLRWKAMYRAMYVQDFTDVSKQQMNVGQAWAL
ncbi:hypothetical protein Pfo_011467 [Paulownia fortunei]|nr:hypothetical protein Pfo_011467 [Paulownia fortunei]